MDDHNIENFMLLAKVGTEEDKSAPYPSYRQVWRTAVSKQIRPVDWFLYGPFYYFVVLFEFLKCFCRKVYLYGSSYFGHSNDRNIADSYYREIYQTLGPGKNSRWNWSAFLFGSMWFFYRKMYRYGVAWLISSTLFDIICLYVITTHVMHLKIIFLFLLILSHVLIGLYANWLYIKQIHKRIDEDYHVCQSEGAKSPPYESRIKNVDKNAANFLILAIMCKFFPFLCWIALVSLLHTHIKSVVRNDRKAAKDTGDQVAKARAKEIRERRRKEAANKDDDMLE